MIRPLLVVVTLLILINLAHPVCTSGEETDNASGFLVPGAVRNPCYDPHRSASAMQDGWLWPVNLFVEDSGLGVGGWVI